MKSCSKCKLIFLESNFSKCSASKDGLAYRCKNCDRAYTAFSLEKKRQTGREWYKKNKERNRQRGLDWIAKNPEKHIENRKRYRQENKSAIYASSRACVAKKPEYYSEKQREWAEANREKCSAKTKKYRAKNPEKSRAQYALYLARQIQATPVFANLKKIEKIYALAQQMTKETGVLHHVDHVIPLRSKIVCGLHIETNLRVITATENCKKSNKFVVVME